MKKLLLILFVAYSLPLIAQSWWWTYFGSGASYDPLTSETGWALYLIGESELATDVWGDQSSNNRDLTLYNTPTLSTEGDKNTIIFNGTDERGKTTNFTLNQPFAIIMVCKEVTLTPADRFCDGNTNDRVLIWRGNPTAIALYAGITELYNTQVSAIDWSVLVAYYNNDESTFTINGSASPDGTIGTNGLNGFTLASNSNGANAANIEVGFVGIIESPTAETLTNIEDYFKTYYGIEY